MDSDPWTRARPHVYGHRGAPGEVPENTIGSYARAASSGVEYVEFDLVCTKDGHLVDRHEPNLSGSTDVASHPEFADRRRRVEFAGVVEEGWFTTDFTLEELRTLRAREPMPALRPHTLEGCRDWGIPTVDEVLALRAQASAERGWELGVIPEIKHSSLFHALGHDPEAALLAALDRAGLSDAGALVRIESFEMGNLVRLRHELGWAGTLVFLVEDDGRPLDHVLTGDPRTFADLLEPPSLERLAGTVDAIGPSKHLVIGRTREDRLAEPTSLVADAHAVGLEVTPWTFRAENHFLPAELRAGTDPAALGDYAAELTAFFEAGVDAVFCDQPALAVEVRDAYLASRT
ncbi:glycerophosphodiester phosphodiesterase [Nostocoides sp. F2B08]|uniref:glycerophosphodiester phosphodiesterase family protein n=1 Tax=Nostocoides sp. F2B08 TaxID=2653936 RepID=UPI001263AB07|nr:glycerophosphodiester phosphodiesterase family protein [Tetrasphaera sp. F2B08]KAB7744691.1 glycerophosphodiester phosphodiesterase [Tetrasphaera sp. F2B08]